MKPTVIDPKTTTRASAFDLWMHTPNPMVTFFKTMDVTPLIRLSRKRDKRGGFCKVCRKSSLIWKDTGEFEWNREGWSLIGI